MAPPRKSVSRGNGDLENDPERENRTQARAPNPVASQADDGDPEVNNATQARAPHPLAKKVRATVDPAKNALFATAPGVAADIVAAIDRGAGDVYVPRFWAAIMPVVRGLPERVFQRLPFLAGR